MSDAKAALAAETDQFFREIVLCLGGIFASHELDDTLIWQITKSLERLYERARARQSQREGGGGAAVPQRRLEPHPAIEDLLLRIGR